MAPGLDSDDVRFLAVNSSTYYQCLCALDVIGLADSPTGDQDVVHQEFREQLTRDPDDGWYETSLPWKGNYPSLPDNRIASLRRQEIEMH
jgi:hypothetical protein